MQRAAGLIDDIDVGNLLRRGDRGAEQRRDREGTPAHHLMKTNFATEGTPLRLRMKSMYGPGGEIEARSGALTFSVRPCAVNLSRMNRWLISNACVTAPSRIQVTEAIRAVSPV